MSQAKVDKYKEYKKNRRANIAKEKRKELLGRIAAWFVVALFVAFIVGAISYKQIEACKARQAALPDYTSSSYVLSDMAGVLETETDTAE